MPRSAVSSAFIVLWSNDRVDAARGSDWAGKALPYLFGGPHGSHPSPKRAGVSAGELIFPVALKGGKIMVLCQCRVAKVISTDAFCGRFKIQQRICWQDEYLREWLGERSCAWLAPTCTDDALLLEGGTPLVFDRFLPADRVFEIRIVSRRGERPLSNVLPDGRLKNVSPLQGFYYRISPGSAKLLGQATREKTAARRRPIDCAQFIKLLAARFPKIAATIDDDFAGLLHLEMAEFARATEAAMLAGKKLVVQKHLAFAEEVLSQAAADVENAICVSYLEHLPFGSAKWVIELLGPTLRREAWKMDLV